MSVRNNLVSEDNIYSNILGGYRGECAFISYCLASMYYRNYLKSESWNNKKKEVLKIKWWKCEKCWTLKNLNIHHWSYKKKYNEPIKHLFVLCFDCHTEFHKKYKMWKSMLNKTMNFIYWKWWRKNKIHSDII